MRADSASPCSQATSRSPALLGLKIPKQKLVFDMPNVRHIDPNAGHTTQNDGHTMQNVIRTMHNVGRNTLNVCKGSKRGLEVPHMGPWASPSSILEKNIVSGNDF